MYKSSATKLTLKKCVEIEDGKLINGHKARIAENKRARGKKSVNIETADLDDNAFIRLGLGEKANFDIIGWIYI